nr:EAL domain-containing protein [Lachnospiraceae bacterium]
LIYKLDLYVLDRVLEMMDESRRRGKDIIPHSINLSRSDFDACDIVEEIRKRVDKAGVSHDRISVEITESVIGSDFDFIKSQIERFHDLGFSVWMDDFGSGYSSFDVLQSVSFDLLKFDMSFMQNLDKGDHRRDVITELMRLASKLGVDTICEGVETIEQVRFLQEIGCAKLQGYYFYKPTPLSNILEIGSRDGLEDPAEAEYYGMIGQTKLYDFSIFNGGNNDFLRNVFDTTPMGIIEIKEDMAQYLRVNQAYREFLSRVMGIDVSDRERVFSKFKMEKVTRFWEILRKCCEIKEALLFEDEGADGSTIHVIARNIGRNPGTGAQAVAIAVLTITNEGRETSYADIARALASDYRNIYYVDLKTEEFIEYSASSAEEIAEERHGGVFFSGMRVAAMSQIYEADRELFLTHFTKENVMKELDGQGTFTMTYRELDEGKPVFVNMRVTRMYPDDDHIIIGVRAIDSHVKQKEIIDRIKKSQDTLASVMALTNGYLVLYMVDPKNDHYIEYAAAKEYEALGCSKMGENFFNQVIIDEKRAGWEGDHEFFSARFSKQQVMDEIKSKGIYKLSYSIVLEGKRKPISLVIVPVRDEEDEILLAGLREE